MASNADTNDILYMKRCLELAQKGSGTTRPNPMVGAVIVRDGRIIGEGFHLRAGEPHAEVIAVNSVKNKSQLKGSTIYVSLEPCSHYGKTPPCADLIIGEGITRVVAGTTDTTSKVAGKGFEKLRNAGVEVTAGVLEEACRWMNRRFFTFHEKERPYVILKWAESSDNYIDVLRKQGDPAEPHWITGLSERVLVHRWRSEEDAILAGGATIRSDNPSLNVRYWSGPDPVKVIVSRSADIPSDSHIFTTPGRVLLFTQKEMPGTVPGTIITHGDDIPVNEILCSLYKEGIQSVIVEGGARILESFISSGLWDEARIFTGRKPFEKGIQSPGITGRIIEKQIFQGSELKIVVNESPGCS
ncbi:MAG TPA: bifunctional diaminohydroxyphosphoribosylaminopyrimidine deaminase/5-amino-6-(5-phosphoribosylamino)uracil reductase RibD [Bacteroidales bacterium]|nr:bifunctional diaminohydroxyphosphoribosylaminopyrimidine deaminase/5-amino-6-(5-phosphoribosylamino)uracil reductase RibD [Bacteroidales bacterium]HPT11540.1 bifunctional diaminohydroxyphosphoribosylaminopyrimidine deaminase/5-amino-6-(5-phosphoribosylamino)uracil reductase RibD [Bacteroidales bacterium]